MRVQTHPLASDETTNISLPSPPQTTTTKTPLQPPQLPSKIRPKLLSTPHEKIWNLPNTLTFTRLLAAPAVGYLILTTQPLLATSLFLYAGVTDLLDGYLARRYHSQTVLGTIIDPMADKALMTIAVVALALQGGLPVWLAALILVRDAGLALAAVYIRWVSLPPPKTVARYWDFSLPSAEVRPTGVSKVNTFLQLVVVGAAMGVPVLEVGVVEAWRVAEGLELLQYLVAGTTVWSGLSYVYARDAWRILTREEIERRVEERKPGEKPR